MLLVQEAPQPVPISAHTKQWHCSGSGICQQQQFKGLQEKGFQEAVIRVESFRCSSPNHFIFCALTYWVLSTLVSIEAQTTLFPQ